jgi:hypothetical protein
VQLAITSLDDNGQYDTAIGAGAKGTGRLLLDDPASLVLQGHLEGVSLAAVCPARLCHRRPKTFAKQVSGLVGRCKRRPGELSC